MGIGDELMMAGEARRRAGGEPKRFLMLSKFGDPRWNEVWAGNPHVARPGEPHDGTIGYVNRRRPYIADETVERRTFVPYEPHPAFIALDARAKTYAACTRGAVVFNPTIKEKASPNKAWGRQRWQDLVSQHRELRWVQLAGPGSRERIHGAEYLFTERFVDACGAMTGARAAVLHEGGLHHAAAALGVPAVVIFGGYITPRVTGYAGQRALFADDPRWPLGCGMRIPCAHCSAAMQAITPQRVFEELSGLLRERQAA